MKLLRPLLSSALALLLAACTVEGGVPPATPEAGPGTALPAPTSPPQPTPTPRQGWTVGLLQNPPADLLPFYSGVNDARSSAPVVELIFPAPLLAVDYTYTTTGVLEQVPTLENGGAALQPVEVFLDAAGNITTTATEVVSQAQQIVVTYRWNPRLAWSDGTPLTAEDSVFAYELALQQPLDDASRARLEATASYEAVDAHTTRAVLKPDVIDPTYLTNVWPPLPRHLLEGKPLDEGLGGSFAREPVGYGPYVVDRWGEGELLLRPNPHFPLAPGEQPLEPVRFVFMASLENLRNELLNGEIDVVQSEFFDRENVPYLEKDEQAKDLEVSYLPSATWEHIDFNLDVPVLQDFRVRRAIALAIDRQRLGDTFYEGNAQALDSWLLPEQWAAAPTSQLTRYPYNSDEANRLLDEVGLLDSDGDGIRNLADGTPLQLSLLVAQTRSGELRAQLAEAIKADLGKAGIALDIQGRPPAELLSPEGPLYRREFQLALFAWQATPDPGGRTLWSCASIPSEANGWQGENFAGWCFRDADIAIRNATTALGRQDREAAYLTQQQLFTQELPALPLFQRVTTLVVAPGVAGLSPDQQAPITWNLRDWTRE
jgi:peptide/nickel transport system substrate-binding protein